MAADSLVEDIERGRKAIALAKQQGKDTSQWEAHLADLERQSLLGWASELAEQELVLTQAVCYVEAPLRTVTTYRVSWYAAHYLKTISTARLQQKIGGWKPWTPKWWAEREAEALQALHSIRAAMEEVHD